MVYNPYAAGNKVYGSGRSNPTSGTVDPMGYVIRERIKRAQGGSPVAAARMSAESAPQSQSRSGLAQTALNRQPQTMAATAKKQPAKKTAKKGGKKAPAKKQHKPFVMVTPNGKLNLPWDMATQIGAIGAKKNYDTAMQDINTARDTYLEDYRDVLKNSGIDYQKSIDDIKNVAGGAGGLYSSGTRSALTDNATRYTDWRQDLVDARTEDLGGFRTDKGEARQDFLQTLINNAVAQGMDVSELAGTLGFGRQPHTNPKPPKKHNKPKPRKKNDDKLTPKQRRRRRRRRNDDKVNTPAERRQRRRRRRNDDKVNTPAERRQRRRRRARRRRRNN